MRSLDLGEEGHESILPPARYVVMLPHDRREVVYVPGHLWTPGLYLGGGKTGRPWALARCQGPAAVVKLLKAKGSMHGRMEFVYHLLWNRPLGTGLYYSVLQFFRKVS